LVSDPEIVVITHWNPPFHSVYWEKFHSKKNKQCLKNVRVLQLHEVHIFEIDGM